MLCSTRKELGWKDRKKNGGEEEEEEEGRMIGEAVGNKRDDERLAAEEMAGHCGR